MIRKTCIAVLLITLASIPFRAHAQEGEEPCKAKESESPNAAFHRCAGPLEAVANEAADGQKKPSEKALKAVQTVAKQVMAEAGKEVEAQASNADAADASGSRVSDSLPDLLPLLQGAVTAANTSGDGMPVVLNFNSPPFLGGKSSLQATLTEPELFAPLEKKLAETDRDVETKGLLDRAGGFGDTTYSLGWSPVRRAGNWSTKRQLFGREPESYRPLVEEYANTVLLAEYTTKVGSLLGAARKSLGEPAKELGRLFEVHPDKVANDMTFSELREKARTTDTVDLKKAKELIAQWDRSEADADEVNRIANDLGALLALTADEVQQLKRSGKLQDQARATTKDHALDLIDKIENGIGELSGLERDAQATLNERNDLDDRFAALIGNQPELQVRASFRDADKAVGPRDVALSVVYAAGSRNINRLLDDYQALIAQRPDSSDDITADERRALKKQAFENLTNTAPESDLWRMTYAITYKKIDDYDENFEDSPDDMVQKPAIPLVVPGVEEWQLRLTYSQLAGPELFAADARPRIAFSLDGTWVQKDNDIPKDLRRRDRVVGRITYTVPTTDNLTFPVSIVFANHPEFLSEDKDLQNQLSAHVGLSYKLPRPGAVKPPA